MGKRERKRKNQRYMSPIRYVYKILADGRGPPLDTRQAVLVPQ